MKAFKYLSILLFLITFGSSLFYIYSYNNKFNIQNTNSHIEEYLNNFTKDDGLKLIQIQQLDESASTIVLVRYPNGEFGFSHLVKGWNNKFLFKSISSLSAITYREYKTNDGLYGAVIGLNEDLEIHHIDLVTSGMTTYETSVNVENEPFFIKPIKLPNGVNDSFPAQFKFYNKYNKQIE